MLSLHSAFDLGHLTAILDYPYTGTAIDAAKTIINKGLYPMSQLGYLAVWTVAIGHEDGRPLAFLWRSWT
jgi:hypothetical protein